MVSQLRQMTPLRLLAGATSQLSPALRNNLSVAPCRWLEIRETAELLGLPAGTAMARLARARSGPKEVVKRTAAAGTYGGSTESLHSGYDQKIEKLGRKKYGHTA